jgi:lysozyme
MNAEDLARKFEGCKLVAYLDTVANPPIWTIGYGHTGKDVHAGLVWSQEQAEEELMHDLTCAGLLLGAYSPNVVSMPGATDALTDFIFNLGIGHYRSSTLCTYVNAKNWAAVKTELVKWDHSNGRVVPGLLARREAESALIRPS